MNREDIISIGRGAALAAGGAALAYLSQWATGSEAGTYGPIVAAVASVLLNVLRKWANPTEGKT